MKVADGRVGVMPRHLVGIDVTLHNSWQTQPQPQATGYPPDLLRFAPRTIPRPSSLVSVSIFQSVLSLRQCHQFRSEHPHGLPAERPEAVTGGGVWRYLRQGRG